MRRCHLAGYDSSKKHIRHIARLRSEPGSILHWAPSLPPSQSSPAPQTPLQNIFCPDSASPHHRHLSPYSKPPPQLSNGPQDQPLLLRELWGSNSGLCTFKLLPDVDIYHEIRESLSKGDRPFSCCLRPETEELGIEGDGDDFGIECPAHLKQTDVHPSAPTYPWPSEEVFATDLLFSSPRLRFSHAQKKAVLSWAKELSAHNVPTLHALKKCQERICKLVGNPTEKKTTNSGNVFYQNSVARVIANDYSNPITRCSMQDYPEEGDGSMSQAHHGTKMLHDLPPSLAAPSILINGKIYSVDELLQQSNGAYFIPKKIFQSQDQLGIVETLAIGHSVVPSEAGFIVDPECIIAPTLTFVRTFKEIQANSQEFTGFTVRHSNA
ncbi:hypothetical protein SERLA73DRAFT_78499 [Serpula lacrymans var. lacrymans S7.3]|uniref:Uncharacterized protein n=1 Tax=Serpula lacrymans var. lacrymans (strain S7.3) TaxID=936435 RepID=F8QDF1_SERL3|nr:hypothetical protein SERLA73DRAFT_78499 [Serpula lacrymans var. lacrymans S7.3]